MKADDRKCTTKENHIEFVSHIASESWLHLWNTMLEQGSEGTAALQALYRIATWPHVEALSTCPVCKESTDTQSANVDQPSWLVVYTQMQQTCMSLLSWNFTCSAHDQTRKWRQKLTLVRLQTWSLTALGEGMKILCIKDHVGSSINDFHERITNASFTVGGLN